MRYIGGRPLTSLSLAMTFREEEIEEQQKGKAADAQGLATAPMREVAMLRMPRPDEWEAKEDVAQIE
jgi:hypothetical protein